MQPPTPDSWAAGARSQSRCARLGGAWVQGWVPGCSTHSFALRRNMGGSKQASSLPQFPHRRWWWQTGLAHCGRDPCGSLPPPPGVSQQSALLWRAIKGGGLFPSRWAQWVDKVHFCSSASSQPIDPLRSDARGRRGGPACGGHSAALPGLWPGSFPLSCDKVLPAAQSSASPSLWSGHTRSPTAFSWGQLLEGGAQSRAPFWGKALMGIPGGSLPRGGWVTVPLPGEGTAAGQGKGEGVVRGHAAPPLPAPAPPI